MELKSLEDLRAAHPWPGVRPDLAPDGHGAWHHGARQLLAPTARLVLEFGAWLGQSTRGWCHQAPGATVIAVDTWLGSQEHQEKPDWAKRLARLYDQFIANNWPLRGRIIPIRSTSQEALAELDDYALWPDLIYLDAAHDYASVREDVAAVTARWRGTQIAGDDWPRNGGEVGRAVTAAVGPRFLVGLIDGRSWYLRPAPVLPGQTLESVQKETDNARADRDALVRRRRLARR